MRRNKFRRTEREEEENKKNEKKKFTECCLSGTRQRNYLPSDFFLTLGKEIVATSSIQTPQTVLSHWFN